MTRILITGGAGFIGTNLVMRALERTNHHVVVVDKITYATTDLALAALSGHPRVTLIRADIADAAAMSTVFAEHRPVAVLNLAAETHVDRSIDSPRAFIETNVLGTFVLLEEARRLVASLPPPAQKAFRFLHVSTDEVFGALGPEGAFTEHTAYDPGLPTRPARRGRTTWCAPTTPPMACRPSSRIVRTTTARFNTPKSSSR